MGVDPPTPEPVLDADALRDLQTAVDGDLRRSRRDLVRGAPRLRDTRCPKDQGFVDLEPMIAYGASPRATLGLVAAGRALALIRGRTYVLPQDVYDIAPDVLRHRLVLSYEALADGVEADDLVNRIVTAIQLPPDRPEPGAGSGHAASRSHRQRPARARGPHDDERSA